MCRPAVVARRRARPGFGCYRIEPVEVFIHCAKAFRRGGVWDPASWPADGDDTPDGIDILACQFGLPDGGAELRSKMAAGYAAELAADLPATTLD